MKEIQGDIWNYHKQGHWIVITTNGTVRKDGACVMGRGVATQAKKRFPDLPYMLGGAIDSMGNLVHYFQEFRIITFPVKHNWWEEASIKLIENSATLLMSSVNNFYYHGGIGIFPLYMVRPGCGNGKLDWKDVRPVLEKYLDDRFIIVERSPNDTNK